MHLEGHLAELDINPLMVLPSGQGMKAVDALVVLRGRANSPLDDRNLRVDRDACGHDEVIDPRMLVNVSGSRGDG
jgi:hypothetical protein